MNIARFACSACGRLQEERGLCPSHGVPLLDLHDSADRAELQALAKIKGAISPAGQTMGGWMAEEGFVLGVVAVLGLISGNLFDDGIVSFVVMYSLVPCHLLLLGYLVFSPRRRQARRLRRALRAVPAPAALIEDQARVDQETAALGSELMSASVEGPPPLTARQARERAEHRRAERKSRSRYKATGMYSMIQ